MKTEDSSVHPTEPVEAMRLRSAPALMGAEAVAAIRTSHTELLAALADSTCMLVECAEEMGAGPYTGVGRQIEANNELYARAAIASKALAKVSA
jgi:hypothetical protein